MPSRQQKAAGTDPITRGSAPLRVVWDTGMRLHLLQYARRRGLGAAIAAFALSQAERPS